MESPSGLRTMNGGTEDLTRKLMMNAQELSPAISGASIRRLDGRDIAGIEQHLLELDMVSRNRRFHCGFGDAAVKAYVRRLDISIDILFGAVEEASGRIVGLAEAHPASAQQTVEVGTSVLPTHRKRGLARELIRRAIAAAFAQGATAAELIFDPSNRAMVCLVAGLGARSCVPGRAVLCARPDVHAPWPGCAERIRPMPDKFCDM
jgi:GNAT superfamily N-acetyltransferase